MNIQQFLNAKAFAVAGASNNREKFGNKVLRTYLQHNKTVYAVNPKEDLVEGVKSFGTVSELPEEVESLSIVTPPAISEKIVAEAISKGIKNIWMQPGAESAEAIKLCEANHINVIAGGPCVLVELGYDPEK
ncbi:MAG: yccU [Gammaproteobacteria bacterium]|jgi:predicted CoA-binding protein|nr:yccU [Gammaproteobacteria bacterium]